MASGRCRFLVWAPRAEKVEVHLMSPADRLAPLEKMDRGYFGAVLEGIEPGALYRYRLDESKERPDPASRLQPQGVHGPSQVVSDEFAWTNASWRGRELREYVLYELHVGTFTTEGTFDSILPRLDSLRDLGITAVELMPVAQFPGSRNWGYDGVYPFAVQNSYGGPEGLRRLVNACHEREIAVVLDVVYNHLGPEGNYLADFGPYFTERYRTPWGPAINFDGPWSDEVRQYFIESALQWVEDFHIDALRLDAIHAIVDSSAFPFLEELGLAVHGKAEELKRRVLVIPESDRNDARFVTPREAGGFGLDAQWSDDFHHALHTLLTGERNGYYADFGELRHLAKALREGFVYSGEYSQHRKRRHGNSSRRLEARQFIVFAQNHDQVGNRMLGDRLSESLSFEALKLAAGAVVLSPFVPLLFMGEEYGERAPFLYFTSHSDADLIEAVRRGRREEFAAFRWQGEPPDPQDEDTFLRSKLDWELRDRESHALLRKFFHELLRLRREVTALAHLSKEDLAVHEFEDQRALVIHRWRGHEHALLALNFGRSPASLPVPDEPVRWKKLLESADACWGGSGSLASQSFEGGGENKFVVGPTGFVLYGGTGEEQEN
jgi:maltooligosyltrehalose trehalohydrolase